MKNFKNSIVVILISVVSLSGIKAADGVKIISETKNLSSQKVSATNIYLTNDKVLVENKGDNDNGAFYFDSSKEEFGYINHIQKEYYLFDKPALDQLKQQVKMMVMMMKQFSANMPEDQRKKLDKFINPDTGGSTSFKAVGKKTKIGKWQTTQYEGRAEGNKITDMYIASFSSVKVSKSDFEAMEKMVSYFRDNLSEVVALLPSGGSFSQIGFDESSPIFREGIPVKTVSYSDGNAKDENVVKSIIKENIDDAIFNIPVGYQRKQINLDGQFGR